MKTSCLRILVCLFVLATLGSGAFAEPVKSHPRLLFRAEDLPGLRARMNPGNDVWMHFKTNIAEKCLKQWKCSSTSAYRLIADPDPTPPDYSYMGWVRTSFTDENGNEHKESDADWNSGGWSYQPDHPAVPEDDIGEPSGNVRMFTEQYAMVFALMARLLEGQAGHEDEHDEYLAAAKGCLFKVIDQAQLGDSPGTPWRAPNFAVNDRSFANESFPLAVDWIYESLDAVELAKVRKAFLLWAEQCNSHVYFAPRRTNGQHGPPNSPSLLRLDDPVEAVRHTEIRLALNNHWANHLRQMVLYGLVMNPSDDIPVTAGSPAEGIVVDPAPAGSVTSQILGAGGVEDWVPVDHGVLRDVTGVWLYLTDYAHRHDGAGGVSVEGTEYASNGLGPVALAMAALQCAGQDNTQVWGPQVSLTGHPLWSRQIPAYLSLLTPTSRIPSDPSYNYFGQIFQPPLWGDLETYAYINDQFIKVLAPMALADARTNGTNGEVVQAVRYIQRNLAQGGPSRLENRISNGIASKALRDSIYYFLIFDRVNAADPSAPPLAADPRPALQPQTFYSTHKVNGKEMGTILGRSGQTAADTYFHFRNDWNAIDHQRGDSLSFGLWKNGLWLTKVMTGYGSLQGCSDYRNSLSLQNGIVGAGQTPVSEDTVAAHGGQWFYSPHGDPDITARSTAANFLYFTGDGTNLYNHNSFANLREIEHASRSLIWLKPDRVVVYDRARSKQAGYFKRFFLNLPDTQANTVITGKVVHSSAKEGATSKAELFVTSLLPAGATPQLTDISSGDPAGGEDMKCRMFTEAPGAPQEARFLHVVQGTAAGVSAPEVTQLVTSVDGAFEGAVTGDTCVIFRKDLATVIQSLVFNAPAAVTRFYVTGLAPFSGYDINGAGGGTVTIQPGTQLYSDGGGVLLIGGNEPPNLEIATAVAEGSEQGNLPLSFTVNRSGNVSQSLTVNYTLAGAATAADFTGASGQFTFAAGSATATLTLTPADDSVYEGPEALTVRLTAAPAYHVSEAAGEAGATVLDNDAPSGGTIQFAVPNFNVAENIAGGLASVTLTRTGGTLGTVSVRMGTANATALAGSDYVTTSTVVTWANGDNTPKVVTIALTDDAVYEGDETVNLSLSQLTGPAGFGSQITATLTIADNEPPPPGVLTLSPLSSSVSESAAGVTFTVTRTGGTGGTVSVNYTTVAGTATAPADFTAASGTLTWLNGDAAAKTVTVLLNDDSIYEGASESFTLVLSSLSGGATLNSAATATVTLLENDPQPAEFHVGDGQAYSSLQDVPWNVVSAGSTVYIHHRAAAYKSKLLLSNRGTALLPIRIIGVAGASGQRPVLDGTDAQAPTSVTYSSESAPETENRSLIAIEKDQSKPANFKPGYIEIRGLELSNAHPDYSYGKQSGGVGTYSGLSGGIYLRGAEHVTIRDCIIHHCANGIETNAGGSAEPALVRDLTIDHCYFYGNGKSGQYYGRNIETQAVGVTLQFSRLDPPLAGANVENVRDLSAGFVARGNYLEGGGSQFDFAEPYSSIPLIAGDSSYGTTHVWGNVLRNFGGGSGNVIHFGGSQLSGARTLHFHHNTVHCQSDYSRNVLDIREADEKAYASNNILRSAGITEFRLNAGAGSVVFGKNLAQSGYLTVAGASGTANIVSSAAMGFVNEAAGDYHLGAGSPAIDAGVALPAGAQPVNVQYVDSATGVLRYALGAAMDCGAFETAQPIDTWRLAQFGLDAAEWLIAADTADPDFDGVPNLLEYAQAGNPWNTSSAPKPQLGIASNALTLGFLRIADSSLHYTVRGSSDLVVWATTPVWSSTGAQNSAGTVTVSDTVVIGSTPRRFLRLEVSR